MPAGSHHLFLAPVNLGLLAVGGIRLLGHLAYRLLLLGKRETLPYGFDEVVDCLVRHIRKFIAICLLEPVKYLGRREIGMYGQKAGHKINIRTEFLCTVVIRLLQQMLKLFAAHAAIFADCLAVDAQKKRYLPIL